MLVGFFKNLGGTLAEEVHLKQRCGYATAAITLDGKPVAGGLAVPGALVEHAFTDKGTRGVVALLPSAAPAELRLVKDGVWIDTYPISEIGAGVVAVVEDDALRKDVSLAKIVADAALGRVVGRVRNERWTALARLIAANTRDGALDPAVAARMRAEALAFMDLVDVRGRDGARTVAATVTWPDARTRPVVGRRGPATVSLVELAALVVDEDGGTRSLRVATTAFAELEAEAPAIPRVEPHERDKLGRVLGCRLVVVDEELRKAHTRAMARRAWLARTMEPRLPVHGRSLGQAAIAGPALRGEVGINDVAAGPTNLIREGCLIAAVPLRWGIDGLEVAVEAMFEPTEDYADVVRDATFVAAALAVLAAAGSALAEAPPKSRGGAGTEAVRAAVRGWLLLALDESARATLWTRLAVPKALQPDEAAVRAALPGPAELERAAPWAMRVQIFEAFDGSRRSLADLAWRRQHAGHIDAIDASVPREPGLGAHVVRLGQDDRRIVTAMFGADAVHDWERELGRLRRERAFRARPAETPDDAAARVRSKLRGWGLDPSAWGRTIDAEGVTGAIGVALTHDSPDDPAALRGGTIELLIEGRVLTTRTLELGIGPIVGFASAADLTANDAWDDVAEGEALTRLTRVVAAAAWSLMLELTLHDAGPGRWVARLMLRRLALDDRAAVEAERPELLQLPLRTLGGATVPLATVLAAVRKHGQIAAVPLPTPTLALPDPPVLREEPAVLEALAGLVGKHRIVSGAGRLLEAQRGPWLLALPVVDEIKLDPDRVSAIAPLDGGSPRLSGEIGLSRTRSGGGLTLELCTQGRRVGVVHEPGFEVACEAIVSDAELPLTAEVEVDRRSKRYGHYLRRCRKAALGLIVDLCKRYGALTGAARAEARALLLAFAATERKLQEPRSGARHAAWDAVRAAPLLTDVWDKPRTLLEVEATARLQGGIEVVFGALTAPPETAALARMIVRADAAAEPALAALGPLRALDERWAEEVGALEAMARAPAATLPNLAKEAWIDRKATIAGGLQAHLWVPRRPAEDDAIVFARGGREVGRTHALPKITCAGLVSGEGLVVRANGVALDERQRVSLAKQACLMIASLAGQVKSSGGRMSREERERARTWLLAVEAALADVTLAGLGDPLAQLRAALAGLVSPALRKAQAQAEAERRREAEAQQARERAAQARAEYERAAAAAAAAAAEAEAQAQVSAAAEEAAPVKPTPEQALIAAVQAELEWARARHGTLLERLRLDHLALETGTGPEIVVFSRQLALQRQHPLIARQLARLAVDQPVDPIDLMFIVSAVYTVMNVQAEEIDAEDEQAFVARMAENLAFGLAR